MKSISSQAITCRVVLRPINTLFSLQSLTQVISRQNHPAILGGNSAVEGFSIWAAEPTEIFQFQCENMTLFAQLQATLEKYCIEPTETSIPCLPLPGWIGYFSYDLSRHIEKIPFIAAEDMSMPPIWLGFYDAMIVYEHRSGRGYYVIADYAGQKHSPRQKFEQLESWLEQSLSHIISLPGRNDSLKPGQALSRSNMTREYYFAALEKIHRHIIEGDIYQINFSQRFECDFRADPGCLFLWQNAFNPSPYAAYLATDDWAIVSASPELFLRIDGDMILTRPIKGTRPRSMCECDDIARDFNRRSHNALLNSEKDKAELMMIVDLERNDLARICIPGTRHVRRHRTIEAYPTVFHTFAEVTGTLPRHNNPELFCDILRATFPGGSITGAPKLRAMEIIEHLEPTRRGVYTGCIGHIGVDFHTTLNIAIRTVVIKNGIAYIQTGGGIVADSDNQAEWDETMIKADALMAGIQAIGI